MTIDGIERENQPAGMSFDERFLASVVVCRRVPPRIPDASVGVEKCFWVTDRGNVSRFFTDKILFDR